MRWGDIGSSSVRFQGLAAAGLAFALVLGLRQLGLLTGAELTLYDALLRGAQHRAESSPVLLVEITEADIQEQGHWPINDHVLAKALRELLDAGARVVGLDLYRDLPVPPGTSALSQLLRDEARLVAVSKFGSAGEPSVPGPPALEGTGRVGFNDVPLDGEEARFRDAVVRRALLFQDDGSGPTESSFALEVAIRGLAKDGIVLAPDAQRPEWMRLGETTIPYFQADDGGYVGADDAGYQMLLDFAAYGVLDVVSLGTILRGELEPGAVAGRVVLLGSNATSIPDIFAIPVGPPVPGLELHGYAVDQLLRYAEGSAAPIRPLSQWQEVALLGAVCLLGGAFAFGGPERPLIGAATLALGLATAVALLLVGSALAFRLGTWVPVTGPALGGVAAAGLSITWASSRERWQRNQLMQIFARHVAPAVADEIWAHRAEVFDEGRVRPRRLSATVMFIDMRGYTQQAEKMEPAQLMTWSNAFMERMAGLVHRHGGVVDDYFGDGIKANFGVPLERRSVAEIAEDARNAVRCAIEMAAELEDLNAHYRAQALPTTAVKIGIHTGSVVAASIGSRERIKYTTVGGVPVTAQRLESTKDVPHDYEAHPLRILVSEATRHHLGEEFRCVPLGEVALAGQSELVAVYRVEPPAPQPEDRS
jgi:adenylate cyclase